MKRFRNKFSEHINDCDCLKKLKKKDFDSYISEEPMYGESDKIKFRYAASGKKTNRKLVPQLVTAGVILAGFIFLIQTTMDPTISSPDPNSGMLEQEDDDSFEKEPEPEEEKELITDIDDLGFDLDLPNYNDRMSIKELKTILAFYELKQSMLEGAKDQMDKQLFAKHKSNIVKERRELLELISQKRREAYEWTVYNSEETLQQHFNNIVPGLKRAEELGLVEEINQTFDLDSNEYDFRIEDIWYNSEGFYIFYSFNINTIPEGRLVSSFSLRHDKYSLRKNWRGAEDVIYDGRVYNAIRYEPLEGPELNKINGQYSFDVLLTLGEDNYLLEDRQIPLIYRKAEQDQYSFDVPINQTYSTEGFKITLDHLEHRLAGNYLKINHDGFNMYGLLAEIDGEEIYESERNKVQDSNIFTFPIRASSELPEIVDVKLKSLGIISDEKLTFEIDTSQVEYKETKIMNRFIGEAFGTEFYIDRIVFEQEGFQVKIRSEDKNEGISFEAPVPPSMPLLGSFSNPFNQIKLVDEAGEEMRYGNLKTTVNSDDDTFGFTLPANDETITVTLSNLLFQVEMDEELTIDIKE